MRGPDTVKKIVFKYKSIKISPPSSCTVLLSIFPPSHWMSSETTSSHSFLLSDLYKCLWNRWSNREQRKDLVYMVQGWLQNEVQVRRAQVTAGLMISGSRCVDGRGRQVNGNREEKLRTSGGRSNSKSLFMHVCVRIYENTHITCTCMLPMCHMICGWYVYVIFVVSWGWLVQRKRGVGLTSFLQYISWESL